MAWMMTANAQIIRWLIKPNYDNISLMYNGMYQVEKEGKKGIVNREGKVILPLEYDSIAQFKDGYALLIAKENSQLLGYVDEFGNITNLKDRGFTAIADHPYFSNGQLLVMRAYQYFFVRGDNAREFGPFADALPFFDGYASVKKYKDITKQNDNVYCTLVLPDSCQEIHFSNNVDVNDINFISSVNKDHALVIMKKKAYEMDCRNSVMSPIYTDPSKAKNTWVTAFDKDVFLAQDASGGGYLQCKNAEMFFDKYRRLSKLKYATDTLNYALSYFKSPNITSTLSAFGDNASNAYGLNFKGQPILPAQLQWVGQLKDNEAIVKLGTKMGVLVVDQDKNFEFIVNNGNSMGFRHDKYESTMVMNMPTHIDSKSTSVESLSDGCRLKKETRKDNSNFETSSVSYDCDFSIPTDISESEKTFEYWFKVKYDALVSIPYSVNIGAWYVKNMGVNMENLTQETNLSDSTVTVKFNIEVDTSDGDHPKDVKVVTGYPDRYPVISTIKLSETSYETIIKGSEYSNIPCTIILQERRCPPIRQSFYLNKLTYARRQQSTSSAAPKKKKKTVSKPAKKAEPKKDLDF